MLARSRIQRIFATVVALLLLSVGTGFASTVFRCAIDGKARNACCCPASSKGTKSKQPTSHDVIASRACCCQIEMAASAAADVRIQADRSDAAKIVVPPVMTKTIVEPVRQMATASTPCIDDHPPVGPPLLHRKCSLLL